MKRRLLFLGEFVVAIGAGFATLFTLRPAFLLLTVLPALLVAPVAALRPDTLNDAPVLRRTLHALSAVNVVIVLFFVWVLFKVVENPSW